MDITRAMCPARSAKSIFRRLGQTHNLAKRTRMYSSSSAATNTSKSKHIPSDGTYPKGFFAASQHVGVKASNKSKDDLALISSVQPCSVAAVFTQNKFQAAPVTVSRAIVQERQGKGIRAVVINSGCANAVTGRAGLDDARSIGRAVDRLLGVQGGPDSSSKSLVMSTGVIGQRLPIERIVDKIGKLNETMGNSHDHFLRAAQAICTTDTIPKLRSREFTLPSYPGITFRLAGLAKGAGMIHPNMATLLGVLFTDAPIAPLPLQKALKSAVDRSFNRTSVDGDTSTNDTIACLANGAGVAPLSPIVNDVSTRDFAVFTQELTGIAQDLARLIVRDGEGATKFVTIHLRGAKNEAEAARLASSVARSALVKTALYGHDANWGRIACALGYTENVSFDPSSVSISFASSSDGDAGRHLKLLVEGEPQNVDEERAKRMLAEEDLHIHIHLGGESGEELTYWTCDFSHDYVTINGDYRT